MRPTGPAPDLARGLAPLLVWIGILTASAAQVAVVATEHLGLLWVVIGADLAVGLVLAVLVGLGSPLDAERAVVRAAVRYGGVLVVTQTVAGCLAALGTVVSADGFDSGALAVPFLGILLAVLCVLCVLMAWWIVVMPVATVARAAAGAIRGQSGPMLHVLFSLLLLEIVALAIASAGHRRWDWPAWPAWTVVAVLATTVVGLIPRGLR